MTTIFKSDATKYPVMLCGRPVWISEAGGAGSLKQVWVHTNPHKDAYLYFCGSSLDAGAPEQNQAYLAELCRDDLAKLPPISAKLQAAWDAEVAELNKPDWLIELELDADALTLMHTGKRCVDQKDIDAFIAAEKARRGYTDPH